MTRDQIYSRPLTQVGQFEFDDSVAEVFPDMIARSVPGYSSMLAMVEQVTRTRAVPDSQLYDLGCSLGAATERMRQQAPPNCRLHAVDSSTAMISRLRQRFDPHDDRHCSIHLHEADIRSIPVQDASVVVLNLTLQFIPPEERSTVLRTICGGMRDEGALLLSEKIRFEDPREQQLMTDLHLDFKRAHGYSELEIAQKRTALEDTLIPETLDAHRQRLQACGFRQVSVWFQCFNFASLLAIR